MAVRKLRTYKDYKGLTPRQAGIKYEKAGKSVADDKKIANWLAANKPEGTKEGLMPYVDSKGQLGIARSRVTGEKQTKGLSARQGYGTNGRKEGTQMFLKEVGKESRRNAQKPSVNRQAQKLSRTKWSDNVKSYTYELSPKVGSWVSDNQVPRKEQQRRVAKLTGRAYKVADKYTEQDRDYWAKKFPRSKNSFGQRTKDYNRTPSIINEQETRRLGRTITKDFKTKASEYRGIPGDYNPDTGQVGRIKSKNNYLNVAKSGSGIKSGQLRIRQGTGAVKSVDQADKVIRKTYGKESYYNKKLVGQKSLIVDESRKVREGRYRWSDEKPVSRGSYERDPKPTMTAADRKKYMREKLAARKKKGQ